MANVLENINLDRIGYGVETNCCSGSTLKLRLETVAVLNLPDTNIMQKNMTVTCVSACGVCQHTKNDCFADNLKNVMI